LIKEKRWGEEGDILPRFCFNRGKAAAILERLYSKLHG
jgi:hypothetical protein